MITSFALVRTKLIAEGVFAQEVIGPFESYDAAWGWGLIHAPDSSVTGMVSPADFAGTQSNDRPGPGIMNDSEQG